MLSVLSVPFNSVLGFPFASCSPGRECRLAAPDRCAATLLQETAKVDHGGPSLLRVVVWCLGRLAIRAGFKLRTADRIIAGLCTLFILRGRVLRSAIVLKPSTLLHFHSVLRKRKYRMLFSHQRGRRPGPKGPRKDLIEAVVAMKRRNPSWGCPRIAQQIAQAFGVDIDKRVVRRIRMVHYRPESDSGGPCWPTFIGHVKDSLWSFDGPFTHRIMGFAVQRGIVDGVALCRMFCRAIRGQSLPKYLSSDHDPLYRFHRWRAIFAISAE